MGAEQERSANDAEEKNAQTECNHDDFTEELREGTKGWEAGSVWGPERKRPLVMLGGTGPEEQRV